MKNLDLYLAKSVFVGILVALITISAIDWLGDLFYQVGRMSAGDNFSSVLLLTVVDVPHKLFEFLPSALLIGTLFSLGQFAASSELVAVGASGYSRLRVGVISCLTGLVVIITLSVLVELYVPISDKAKIRMQQEKGENILLTSDQSYWVREQQRIVRVGQAVSENLLNDIEIYNLTESNSVESIAKAKSAIRQDDGVWELIEFRQSKFAADNSVAAVARERFIVPELFLKNFLQSVTSDPFKMSVQRLNEYIYYLEENSLDAREYQVALYKRLVIPLTGLAMILLALPLVFRPRQLGGIGQRLLIGVVMALLVYILVEAITNGAVVYQLSPVIAAILPVMIILVCSVFAFRFTR